MVWVPPSQRGSWNLIGNESEYNISWWPKVTTSVQRLKKKKTVWTMRWFCWKREQRRKPEEKSGIGTVRLQNFSSKLMTYNEVRDQVTRVAYLLWRVGSRHVESSVNGWEKHDMLHGHDGDITLTSLVLESPVQSSYWGPGGSNQDRDQLVFSLKLKITGPDHYKLVMVG